MIHRNSQTLQVPAWQKDHSQAIKDPHTLFEILDLPKEYLPKAIQAHRLFPLRAPLPYVSRIIKGDINDPLLRQILPLDLELREHAEFTRDPVGDLVAEKLPGLIHKYHGRVLLTLTGACGIHCRYCFRRHFDYQASNPTRKHWEMILDYLRQDESIQEVIFSGGDPLSLTDARLYSLISDLQNIKHIKFLRIHTRQPVVIPQRISNELLSYLSNTRLKTVMVLHVNHAQEIDSNVQQVISALKQANLDLLNQAVLLKNVNDDPDILTELSLRLGESGVFPYYLHLLDKVTGASHFEVSENTGRKLIEEIRQRLPGYLVPRLVKEISGAPYKQAIF